MNRANRMGLGHATGLLTAAMAILLFPASVHAFQAPQPGSASAQTVKLPSGPGSVRGLADDPTVSTFSGQVSYGVAIPLPAAAGGFSPALSLAYSGTLGNGPLGIGWHLTFPAIQRSVRL